MGNLKDRKPKKTSHSKKTDNTPIKVKVLTVLRKPVVWIGTIVLAVMAPLVTAWIKPIATDTFGNLTDTGDPVSVTYSLQAAPSQPMSLPPEKPLSSDDLGQLNELKPAEQGAWLEQHGGIPIGRRSLSVTLKGNRTHRVRVSDVRLLSDCAGPSRGSLAITAPGRGAVSDSRVIFLFAGSVSRAPNIYNPTTHSVEPLFPATTITLERAEEEYLPMELIPQAGEFCRAKVELTVIDGDKEVRQLIPATGDGFQLLPLEELDAPYPAIYLGGELCKKTVRAPVNYANASSVLPVDTVKQVCGPGNGGSYTTDR